VRPPWRCSRRRPGCRITASSDQQTHQRTPRGMRPAVSHSAVHAGGVSGTGTRSPSTASAPAPVISKGIKVSRPMRLTRTIKLFPLAEPGPPFVPARRNIHTWDDRGGALGGWWQTRCFGARQKRWGDPAPKPRVNMPKESDLPPLRCPILPLFRGCSPPSGTERVRPPKDTSLPVRLRL
jgi:hypothetical protein